MPSPQDMFLLKWLYVRDYHFDRFLIATPSCFAGIDDGQHSGRACYRSSARHCLGTRRRLAFLGVMVGQQFERPSLTRSARITNRRYKVTSTLCAENRVCRGQRRS